MDRLRRALRRAGCAQGLGQGRRACPRWPRWATQQDPHVSDHHRRVGAAGGLAGQPPGPGGGDGVDRGAAGSRSPTCWKTTCECWLLNAQHLKNVPGRKTDVADAAWIAQLVEHGLVRPSFVPPRPIRELRELTRYRKALLYERTRQTQRLHKVLEDAGTRAGLCGLRRAGVSGRAMLEALVGGTTDPEVLPRSGPGQSAQQAAGVAGGAPGAGRASPPAAGGRAVGAPGLPGRSSD